MSLDDKIKEAEQALRLGAEMSEYYYHAPLIICYSGGKDSDVLLNIAKKCLTPEQFEVLNAHTTVDAPETVYHIRDTFKALEAEGIHTEIRMPMYKGKRTTMWDLIEEIGIPHRMQRTCCFYLKETSTPNRMTATGVRESESRKRQGRDTFVIKGHRAKDYEYRSLGHTYAMFKIDKNGGEDAYECLFIQKCKANKDTMCNPIYHFTDSDIWEYVERFKVATNPLYAKGFKRVGCVGCPLAGAKNMIRDFEIYPQYKKNYIKAFERRIAKLKEAGKNCPWQNGEEAMRWWLGENPKQVRIEDIIEEETNG